MRRRLPFAKSIRSLSGSLGRVGKIAFVEVASDFAVGQGATSGDILCNIDARSNANRREKRRDIGEMEFANTP